MDKEQEFNYWVAKDYIRQAEASDLEDLASEIIHRAQSQGYGTVFSVMLQFSGQAIERLINRQQRGLETLQYYLEKDEDPAVALAAMKGMGLTNED